MQTPFQACFGQLVHKVNQGLPRQRLTPRLHRCRKSHENLLLKCHGPRGSLGQCQSGIARLWLNVRPPLPLVILVACMGLSGLAHASSPGGQPSTAGPEPSPASRKLMQEISSEGYWRDQLVKAGVIEESGPFRPALPLAKFGENGQNVVLTYGKLPTSGIRPKALMVLLRVPVR